MKITKEELELALSQGLTYKQIAEKFSCTYSLIALRVSEYKLHEYYSYVNKSVNKVLISNVLKLKGKYQFNCKCFCGNEFISRPCDVISARKISCGCIKPKVSGKLTKTILSIIRCKAKHRNIEFNISLEYAQKILDQQNHRCIYSGIDITFPQSARDRNFTASLDRIDSSKGYIEGNIQWLDKRVNSMKNDMSESEFLELCQTITKYQSLLGLRPWHII